MSPRILSIRLSPPREDPFGCMMRAGPHSEAKSFRGDYVKTKTILLCLATLCVGVVSCFAAMDVNMGTWKLNEAKSMIGAGAAKNVTVVYAAMGDSVKVTTDGVDASGKAAHTEWTGKFDGNDYAVTGDPSADTRAYTRVDDHTLSLIEKKGSAVVETGRVVVSADGMSRTLTINGTDASGNKITSTLYYDKQ
jgi:hypothetical protein